MNKAARKPVKKLSERADKCANKIARSVHNSRQEGVDGEPPVWGQFYSGEQRSGQNQNGIYGTAAAASILLRDRDSQRKTKGEDALKALPGWHEPTNLQSGKGSIEPKLKGEDLDILLKSAAVMDAFAAANTTLPASAKVVKILIESRVKPCGWGYVSIKLDPHVEAKVLPTAVILRSLASHEEIITQNQAALVEATLWLAGQTQGEAGKDLRRLEAIASLRALTAIEPKLTMTKKEQAKIEEATNSLIKDLVKRFPNTDSGIDWYEHVHYQAPSLTNKDTPSREGRYLFYPSRVVAAIALLESKRAKEAPKFIQSVVKQVCDNLERNEGKFVSEQTGQAALADAHYAFLLLTLFSEAVEKNEKDLVVNQSPLFWIIFPVTLIVTLLVLFPLIQKYPGMGEWVAVTTVTAFITTLVSLITTIIVTFVISRFLPPRLILLSSWTKLERKSEEAP